MCVQARLGLSVLAGQMITAPIEIVGQMCLFGNRAVSSKSKTFPDKLTFSGQGPVIYKSPPITVWRYG